MEVSKKVGIVISLILALLFTTIIVAKANHRNSELNEKVQVARATHYIPAGSAINAQDVNSVDMVKSYADGLVQYNDVIGKTTRVSILKDQYIYSDGLSTAGFLKQGYVEVYMPVQINSSAFALPGDRVDVYIVNKNTKTSAKALSAALVIDSLDNQGKEVEIGETDRSKVTSRQDHPSAVGIMVPEESAAQIVAAADEKNVYLVKCAPEGS
ncbi:MAG: hypothetical protein A4E56_00405 [Pelotomaculum sp. PtaU1.Bin065]|nr:MAG: hypothetical protein A4E56_00405 [Pelotomaculum sp. PtaU1.Bin065]